MYSHRNGETDLPEVAGLYFVHDLIAQSGGVVHVSWQLAMPAIKKWGIAAVPAHFEVWVIGSEVDTDLSTWPATTRWWGPLTFPWEENHD